MAASFLSLPLELRIPIYRRCLPYSKLESRANRDTRLIETEEDNLIRWYTGSCPAILFVNRQTHTEACDLLYHENTFSIYVRHPRHARLPMNASRADDDSFVLISWKHRNWAHPKNPKISLAVLRKHSHFSSICRLHINLPTLMDLAGNDLYMRTLSYPSRHGLNAWLEKLSTSDGRLANQDEVRMNYIKSIKGPIDEVAKAVQNLPHIKDMVIFSTCGASEIAIFEFVIAALLQLRGVQRARLLYRAAESLRVRPLWHLARMQRLEMWLAMMEPRLRDLERQLESAPRTGESKFVPAISPQALEMLDMLRTTRTSMLLFRLSNPEATRKNLDSSTPILGWIMPE